MKTIFCRRSPWRRPEVALFFTLHHMSGAKSYRLLGVRPFLRRRVSIPMSKRYDNAMIFRQHRKRR